MLRAMVFGAGALAHKAGPGSQIFQPKVELPGDADVILKPTQMLAGAIMAVLTGARAYTTPTAVELNTAIPDMSIGESFSFVIGASGGTCTLTGGTDVTLVGGGAVATTTGKYCVCQKMTATTYTIYCF